MLPNSPPPPKYMRRMEHGVLNSIFHVATNAFSLSAFLSLDQSGGPKIKSIGASMRATMLRTAGSTLPFWEDWVRQLQIAARTNLSLREIGGQTLSPSFWDTPPIALSLGKAWVSSDDDDLCKAHHDIRRELTRKLGRPLLPGHCGKLPIQKISYPYFLRDLHPPDSLGAVVLKRINTMGNDLDWNPPYNDIPLTQVLNTISLLSNFSKQVTFKVVKTWVNSWATSRRYHEDTLFPCLLGCEGCQDDLFHYMECPMLWNIIRHHFPNLYLSQTIHGMGFCLSDLPNFPPPELLFDVLASLFHGYHSVKSVRVTETPASIEFHAVRADCEGAVLAFLHSRSLYSSVQVGPLYRRRALPSLT